MDCGKGSYQDAEFHMFAMCKTCDGTQISSVKLNILGIIILKRRESVIPKGHPVFELIS